VAYAEEVRERKEKSHKNCSVQAVPVFPPRFSPFFREGDEMHMVGHEAPAQEAGLGVLEVLAQKAEVGGTVLIGRKGLAAIHAPLGDMARQFG
jgi:hypothetical protein